MALIMLLPARLDAQLRRDSGLSHFEYWTLVMLSEAPGSALRMTALARDSAASASRVSHVIARLEQHGLVRRIPAPADGRG
ncbi:MAG: MarR family transcriptional regulator, partial [Actinobacteria bacterium]|nr:MarR family transcriptional regulator [Actinomycetota bacterium]